ncbi:prolipoprotein diacylglyceryl transferase [Paenibacillus validus]|uniref:prolipoprotein diacylglyceryl transferase n=1 Tax=Paenibacillus TaxID=44249 RepID=UPI000FD895B8|nr:MULTISPECIES: prolipoprotein diacylglyceryl transferase [Paenibacillus]MED4599704.1 prolipoprotein diacylglyceryl transferase [Paenibacillus validus]MED4604863.1 prolipoprotein diacylglyceryl transferase [Paenibacillus validus]NTZ19067.1 prolipoprotein diacylglyceryl transferase [Paenibacillus sp. JMULE4]
MRVILFSIGDFQVRSYGLVVALAIMLAMGVAYYLAKGTTYRKHIPNMMFYVLIGAILVARIWHVFFFQWDYYSKHLVEIPAIWNGGIAIQGALVGGFIAAAIYARVARISFWELADTMAPAIIFGQAIGRIACFLNGDAYGSPTGSSFGIVYPEGTMAYAEYGPQPLWPAEIWEGQWDFIVFAILLIMKNKTWPKGFLFLSYNILYAIGRFMLEFLRGDSPRYLFNWTAGQWTSVVVIVISLVIMMIFTLRQKRKDPEDLSPKLEQIH